MPWVIVFLIIRLLLPGHAAWADDAAVLPHGVFRLGAEARFSLPITKRFTPGGGTEDLAADFNLWGSDSPQLAALGIVLRF